MEAKRAEKDADCELCEHTHKFDCLSEECMQKNTSFLGLIGHFRQFLDTISFTDQNKLMQTK